MSERRTGVHIDAERLNYECDRRGWSYAELARRAKVGPVLVSRAVHGQSVLPSTLAKLARALASQPPLPAADSILPKPGTKMGAADEEEAAS